MSVSSRVFKAGAFPDPHTPEALDLPVPGSPLGAQFDLVNVSVLLWAPELGEELVVGRVGSVLRGQAHLTGIEVVLHRVGIAHLVVLLLLRVVVHLSEGAAGRRCPLVVHPH